MNQTPVPTRLSPARMIGALAALAAAAVIFGRPVERPHLQVVSPEALQPLSGAELPVSKDVTYTAPSSYHTGPTQGPTG